VQCVRETEILVEQQPPQEVLVCDHSGLLINKSSQGIRARFRIKRDPCLLDFQKIYCCTPPTLAATQGQILSQSPTDAISSRWHLYGS